MVLGTLSLVQKGQTSGCSGRSMQWNSGIWWWGHCLWCKKVKPVNAVDAVHSGCSTQWMQYTVDAVCSRCSGTVVYGGGDIVFDTKKVKLVDTVDAVCSTQWMQWNSDIWWWGHCLWCKKVKPVDAVDAVCSGHSGIMVYGGGDIVFGAKRSNQ